MDNERIRPVVGVFGGSSNVDDTTLDLADRLGSVISRHGWIILTGGTGPKDDSVKNRAIKGAARNEGACWVGVKRTKGDTPKSSSGKSWIAIQSTLNHQRNYLEACMVDAAICLEGGQGTLSELACCLVLRRPIALVGLRWKTNLGCDLDDDMLQAAGTLVRATKATFKNTGRHTLEPRLIAESVIWSGVRTPGAYEYFQPGEVDSIANWMQTMLPVGAPCAGYFPDVAGHATVKHDYNLWLSSIGATPSYGAPSH